MNDEPLVQPGGQRSTRARTKSSLRATPARETDIRAEPLERTERLTRTRKKADDRFHIDPKMVPAGVSYEWKRKSCYGAPDTDHITNLMDNHWAAVPQSRHPNLVTEKDGMILMERPEYLTREAQVEDYNEAMGEVIRVSQGLTDTPAGTFTREHPSAKRVSGIKTQRVGALVTDRQGQLIVPE